MAATTRPLLRSSRKENAGLDELPATVLQHNTLQKVPIRRGKRLHDLPVAPKAGKKPRLSLASTEHPKLAIRHRATEVVFAVATNSPQAVTTHSPTTSAPQPISNGNAITASTTHNNANGVSGGKSTVTIQNKDSKRNLRSHNGGLRSKSELALYFPNYDELISREPTEPDFLTAETRIHITDELTQVIAVELPSTIPLQNVSYNPPDNVAETGQLVNRSLHTPIPLQQNNEELNDAQYINLSSIELDTRPDSSDPLEDTVYFKAHRRAERQEKQLRNIEKERAQHEKVQLERLLDGLKGHDWLKVMGISGVTDSEKRAFEEKRDYFIQEVGSLVEKFRVWKEEEKRRRLEREQALADEEEAEEDDTTNSPSDSDTDDARTTISKHTDQSRRPRPSLILHPPAPEKPFTSFYSKPYLRDAAISKHRRGRTRFAFGQPVPDVQEREFCLPQDMRTRDTVAKNARSRRRARREREG